MNEINRLSTLQFMNWIMSHPSTKLFQNNTNLIVKDDAGIITHYDLNSILHRIQNNEYRTPRQCFDDIDTCWTCAEKNSMKKQMFERINELSLIQYNRSLVEKENQKARTLNPNGWATEIHCLRERLTKLMSSPPQEIREITPVQCYLSTQSFKIENEKLKRFIRATEMIKKEEEIKEMISIIKEFQPELISDSQEMCFDATKLSVSTFKALKTYVKAILGTKYPK